MSKLCLVQYKEYVTDDVWLPEEGIVLFKTEEDGSLVNMPTKDMQPLPVHVGEMKFMVSLACKRWTHMCSSFTYFLRQKEELPVLRIRQ
jgi:hypothetical protein